MRKIKENIMKFVSDILTEDKRDDKYSSKKLWVLYQVY